MHPNVLLRTLGIPAEAGWWFDLKLRAEAATLVLTMRDPLEAHELGTDALILRLMTDDGRSFALTDSGQLHDELALQLGEPGVASIPLAVSRLRADWSAVERRDSSLADDEQWAVVRWLVGAAAVRLREPARLVQPLLWTPDADDDE